MFVRLYTGCSQQFAKGWIVECGLRGLHFGVFFAAAGASSKLSALPGDGRNEILCVIWPFGTDDLIEWRFYAHRLNEFLELSLGIGVQRAAIQGFEIFGEESLGKLVRGVGARIEVDGPCDGFEGIGQGGFAIPAAVRLFTSSHVQVGTESNAAGDAGERLGGNELGTCLGQRTLVGLGQALKEQMRQGELQHGVAEEFEALVVRVGALVFVTNAAVRERKLQQRGIAKGMAYDVFQRLHVCLFCSRKSGSTP